MTIVRDGVYKPGRSVAGPMSFHAYDVYFSTLEPLSQDHGAKSRDHLICVGLFPLGCNPIPTYMGVSPIGLSGAHFYSSQT